MSDDPKTHSAKDIVLEIFPATSDYLIPKQKRFYLVDELELRLVKTSCNDILLSLTPIPMVGKASSYLCCDLCAHQAPRTYLQVYRAEVAHSKGRRFRYITLCASAQNCESRRFSDQSVQRLLDKLGVNYLP